MATTNISAEQLLFGGGEMGRLMRAKNWAETPLGNVEDWPQSLKTCVRIVLTSRQPMFVWWGEELINIYNDAYLSIIGGKHPQALGQPASVVWREIWDQVGPRAANCMLYNEGTYDEALLLLMHRNGYPEETYYTFSYSPVPGDNGDTGGIICANTDDTQKIVGERQLRTLTDLGKLIIDCKTNDEVYAVTMKVLQQNPQDFPFCSIYEIDKEGSRLTMEGKYPQHIPASFFPDEIDMDERGGDLPILSEVLRTGKTGVIKDVIKRFGEVKGMHWDAPSNQYIVIPVKHSSQKVPYAILGVGINPYKPLDEKYESFFQLVADQVATALANIHAYEEERKRAEVLAEIDRAKTVFFSNISHEFRTPLTLMLGPLEELIEKDGFSKKQKENIETAHRNAIRLLRLVNALLDFSRIESERMQARFQPVNLAEYTISLASNFQSIMEKAGLQLVLRCHTTQPVYIDIEMWQKIVFNLLSNAFKYTLEGSITITLREENGRAILAVTDTGVGIPEKELPRMFERFHRVQNSEGRTHEGTGIGLSLVNELVKLHHGTITVESVHGRGSTFTVSLPLGAEHLDEDQVIDSQSIPQNLQAGVYLKQVSGLIDKVLLENTNVDHAGESPTNGQSKEKVLIVDDNADMKDYIRSVLEDRYYIDTAANGRDALDKLAVNPADIVISDIMMPVMDGIELLREIKNNTTLAHIPVIMLSARAGEEAKLEGIEMGADDYLVKPFSAKELAARVRSQLNLVKKRTHIEKQLNNLFKQAPVAICIFRGPEHILELANEKMLTLWGKNAQVLHKPVFEAMPEARFQGFEQILNDVYTTGQRFTANEIPVELIRNGNKETIFIQLVYEALYEEDGSISGIVAVAVDVTEQVEARKKIEISETRQKLAIDAAKMGAFEWDMLENDFIYSESLCRIFGYPPLTPLTRSVINDNIHPDDVEVQAKAREESVSSGILLYEVRFIWPDGSLHWIRVNGKVMFSPANMPLKMYGTVLDITGQKNLEDRLEKKVQERTKELYDANKQLERSNHELGQFAYIASHDLQEPLRKIQTFTHLLEENLADKDASARYFNKIHSSAQRMTDLIKAVLNYSRISKTGEEFVDTNLNTILENVKTDFELLLNEKNAVIKSTQLPVIKAIPLQVTQLFYNLVGNSLKFSTGNPEISISSTVVNGSGITKFANADPFSRYVMLSFKDNGIGFEQQYAEQIFTIFQRLNSHQAYAGTGIGLALCRKIVENHHGFIDVTSEAGKGATFYVYLPL